MIKILYSSLGLLLAYLYYYMLIQRNNIVISENKCVLSNKKCY